MPTFTAVTTNYTNSSDANFRSWGSYLSARFAAVGLVQTADTGQINWTTVLTPTGASVYMGYEIWRFADTLQATAPVFFKIQYGEGAGVDSPHIKIQFGSGSDGAGNLTGNLSTTFVAGMPANTGAGLTVGSGSTNRFVFCGGFPAASNVGLGFGFERSVDAAGNPTAEAILWIGHKDTGGSPTGVEAAVWSTTLGMMGTLETTLGVLFPHGNTSISGAQNMVFPVFHNKGVFMNPGLNAVGYLTESISPSGTISVYMYGMLHSYYTLPAISFVSGAAFRGVGSGTESIAIRYE